MHKFPPRFMIDPEEPWLGHRPEYVTSIEYVSTPEVEALLAAKDKEIARLRKALEFIANPRECPQCSLDNPAPEVPCYCDIWNPVYLAREALKGRND